MTTQTQESGCAYYSESGTRAYFCLMPHEIDRSEIDIFQYMDPTEISNFYRNCIEYMEGLKCEVLKRDNIYFMQSYIDDCKELAIKYPGSCNFGDVKKLVESLPAQFDSDPKRNIDDEGDIVRDLFLICPASETINSLKSIASRQVEEIAKRLQAEDIRIKPGAEKRLINSRLRFLVCMKELLRNTEIPMDKTAGGSFEDA